MMTSVLCDPYCMENSSDKGKLSESPFHQWHEQQSQNNKLLSILSVARLRNRLRYCLPSAHVGGTRFPPKRTAILSPSNPFFLLVIFFFTSLTILSSPWRVIHTPTLSQFSSCCVVSRSHNDLGTSLTPVFCWLPHPAWAVSGSVIGRTRGGNAFSANEWS